MAEFTTSAKIQWIDRFKAANEGRQPQSLAEFYQSIAEFCTLHNLVPEDLHLWLAQESFLRAALVTIDLAKSVTAPPPRDEQRERDQETIMEQQREIAKLRDIIVELTLQLYALRKGTS